MLDQLLIPLSLASLALLAALSTAVVLTKIARTAAERRSARRRARYTQLVCHGSHPALVGLAASVRRSGAAQEDLLHVLDEHDASLAPERRRLLEEAAHEAGLDRRALALLGSARAVARGRAALLAGLLRLPGAIAALESALCDRDPDVRHAAAWALGRWPAPAATAALIRSLHPARALPAERIVERIAAPWAPEILMIALDRHYAPAARARLAEALGLVRAPQAAPALLELLATGELEERVQAARALGRIGTQSAVPALARALSGDTPAVRAQAARALEAIGDPSAVSALEQGLADVSWWVRGNCARALSRLGADGRSALERACEHPDRFARERATEALAVGALALEPAR